MYICSVVIILFTTCEQKLCNRTETNPGSGVVVCGNLYEDFVVFKCATIRFGSIDVEVEAISF